MKIINRKLEVFFLVTIDITIANINKKTYYSIFKIMFKIRIISRY